MFLSAKSGKLIKPNTCISHSWLDLLYPRTCLICQEDFELIGNRHVCDLCLDEMYLIGESSCKSCGRPLWGDIAPGKICSECDLVSYSFDQATSILFLREKERKLIHSLKYDNGFYLKEDIVYLINRTPYLQILLNNSILIPVPLHRSKLKARGYNQSMLLAECLASSRKDVIISDALKRVENTSSQTHLNKDERAKNVKNAFALKEDFVLNADKQWIVVDDVFTTGATVEACCSILKQKYQKTIYVLTLGHG